VPDKGAFAGFAGRNEDAVRTGDRSPGFLFADFVIRCGSIKLPNEGPVQKGPESPMI